MTSRIVLLVAFWGFTQAAHAELSVYICNSEAKSASQITADDADLRIALDLYFNRIHEDKAVWVNKVGFVRGDAAPGGFLYDQDSTGTDSQIFTRMEGPNSPKIYISLVLLDTGMGTVELVNGPLAGRYNCLITTNPLNRPRLLEPRFGGE